MKRDDIVTIICKLRHCEEYKDMTQEFLIDILEAKYMVNFEKSNDQLVSFSVKKVADILTEQLTISVGSDENN